MADGLKISFRDKIELKTISGDFFFEIEIGDEIHLSIHSLDEVDYDGNRHYGSLFEEYINKENGEIVK